MELPRKEHFVLLPEQPLRPSTPAALAQPSANVLTHSSYIFGGRRKESLGLLLLRKGRTDHTAAAARGCIQFEAPGAPSMVIARSRTACRELLELLTKNVMGCAEACEGKSAPSS